MDLKLLTNDSCDQLLKFLTDESIRAYYDTSEFPRELINEINIVTGYHIEDELELSPDPKEDGNNSIKIFKALKNLDRTQANDRRLWVGLTHGRFYNYTRKRWMTGKGYSSKAILRRFHYEGYGLETRMRNSISRLWWGSRITYDETLQDPFELTKILWSRTDFIQNIVERSYGTYNNVVKGFLLMFKMNPQLKERELRQLYTGLNAFGGVKMLPLLSLNEVIQELGIIANYHNIKLSLEVEQFSHVK